MATFVLGVWMGCSVLMAFLVAENMRFPNTLVTLPPAPATALFQKLGVQDTMTLLQYNASEQNRAYVYNWERIEIALALTLGVCLLFGTQQKPFPLVLCGLMLILVLLQHFALMPELTSRGREADFPPGSKSFEVQSRLWAIQQAYVAVEGGELLLGGILASYLFVFRPSRRISRKLDMIDHPHHGHVDRGIRAPDSRHRAKSLGNQ